MGVVRGGNNNMLRDKRAYPPTEMTEAYNQY